MIQTFRDRTLVCPPMTVTPSLGLQEMAVSNAYGKTGGVSCKCYKMISNEHKWTLTIARTGHMI